MTTTKNNIHDSNAKLAAVYFIGEFFSVAGMGVALLLSAGRINWWPAWAAMAVMLAWMSLLGITLLRKNPELLKERVHPPKDAKKWDTNINLAIRLLTLTRYIIAGLDQRYGWTHNISPIVQLIALLGCALGYALFLWAATSNSYFTQIIRIQTERGQIVEKGGPYKIIRHPSYLGVILFELSVSFLFASWWALIPSIICVLLLLLRTQLEDSLLKKGLAGYDDYAKQVRFRLLPGLW